ncbi:hypothetical protein HMPREF9078_00883 [Capnocytophaga sp. oral taxon 380 str. F0488]|nr:hypothetical protein HMPREF9078_00883 [Capnocytophaga sp. oral taxon 380 str. F0488]
MFKTAFRGLGEKAKRKNTFLYFLLLQYYKGVKRINFALHFSQ